MAECRRCREPLKPGAHFCGNCGLEVDGLTAQIRPIHREPLAPARGSVGKRIGRGFGVFFVILGILGIVVLGPDCSTLGALVGGVCLWAYNDQELKRERQNDPH